MATARGIKWGGLNLSDEEYRLLSAVFGRLAGEVKDPPDLIRKCLAIGLPVLLQNPLLCRAVDLKDMVDKWEK